MSLPEALEEAARALPQLGGVIRPANGDPEQLRAALRPEEAEKVLAWLLEKHPEQGEELAEAWVDAPEGMAALASIQEETLSKPGRKALRRLRHRLRSRGLELAPPAPAPRVATLPDLDDGIGGAWVTPYDPSGARIVYLVAPHPQGGARLFEVVIDDLRGILGFDLYAASRKKARSFLRELEGRGRFAAVPAEEQEARALVARAAALHSPGRPAPRGFSEWRSQLAPEEEKASLPGDRVATALGDAVGSQEALVALVRAGRIGPWPPEDEALQRLHEKLREALESRLVVSGTAQQARIDALLDDAVGELYDEAGSRLTAHRLRESAYVLWRTGDEEAARACLAGARAFEAGDPRENPAARALVETLLGPALEAMVRERAEQEEPRGEPGAPADPAASQDEGPRILKP